MRIIGYERASTARQGASGLGIEAQRQAIDGFVAQRGATLIARFTEVESGRNPDRPELQKALHLAKVTGATLVIAKLDRLSRNAARQRREVRRGRPAGGERPHRRHHGPCRAAGARGDFEADEGDTGRGQDPWRAARQPQWRGGAPAGRQGRCGAPGGDREERRPACAGPRLGGRRHPLGRRDQPTSDRPRAECPRHAHAARRAMARLDRDEPARPARAKGRAMRQSRLISLIEAVSNVAVGLIVAMATNPSSSRFSACRRRSART